MKKTLYSKLILAFMTTLLISGFLSISLMKTFYFDKINNRITKMMISTSEDIANLYRTMDEKEFTNITNTSIFSNYSIKIVKPDGSMQQFGENRENYDIKEEQLDIVNANKIYVKEPKNKILPVAPKPIVGYPFELNNEKYSVFIAPNFVKEFYGVAKILHINMFIIIVTGITTFAIVGIMIVKKIKRLTIASRQVSKGDYNVKVDNLSKDELGELGETFNLMVERLGKTEKMRQEFVSNVSHEIQSPITSIMGFANLLQSDYIDETDKKKYAKIIEDESKRLSKLSVNLLKLAQLDNNQKIVNKEEYSLDEQIRRVILMLHPKWNEKNIEFELNLPKVKVQADKDLLEQVWINLIGNSIKFSHNDSKIYISINTTDTRIKVSIKDEGIGMSQEIIDKIFQRFYQGDESRKIEGSGLGLSIVNKIVKIHNGEIIVKSKLNEGSEFTIIL